MNRKQFENLFAPVSESDAMLRAVNFPDSDFFVAIRELCKEMNITTKDEIIKDVCDEPFEKFPQELIDRVLDIVDRCGFLQ